MNFLSSFSPLPPAQVSVTKRPPVRQGLHRLTPIKLRPNRRAPSRPRVLVVDDDPFVCAATLQSLKALGYVSLCCLHPSEALWHLKGNRFDVVLTDFLMPSLNGLEFAGEARKSGCSIPFVLMTGYSSPICDEDLRRNDVRFVLRKPFLLDHLGYALKTSHTQTKNNGECTL